MKILITESQYKKLIKEIDDESTKIDHLKVIVNDVREKTSNVSDVEKLTPSVRNTLKKDYEVYYGKLKHDNTDELMHSFNRYCFRHWHQGIDVGGKSNLGDEIVFKKPFKVVSGPSGKGNNCFSLETEDGLQHKFCHSKIVYVTQGKNYPPYTVIALVGNEGSSTAPHVHYEIRQNGKVMKPEALGKMWKTYWGLLDTFLPKKFDISKIEKPEEVKKYIKDEVITYLNKFPNYVITYIISLIPYMISKWFRDGVIDINIPILKEMGYKPAGMRDPIEKICDDTISNLMKPDMDEENIVSDKDNENKL